MPPQRTARCSVVSARFFSSHGWGGLAFFIRRLDPLSQFFSLVNAAVITSGMQKSPDFDLGTSPQDRSHALYFEVGILGRAAACSALYSCMYKAACCHLILPLPVPAANRASAVPAQYTSPRKSPAPHSSDSIHSHSLLKLHTPDDFVPCPPGLLFRYVAETGAGEICRSVNPFGGYESFTVIARCSIPETGIAGKFAMASNFFRCLLKKLNFPCCLHQ